MATPISDYTNRDYDSLVATLLDVAALKVPEWTDQSENDLGRLLLELFAYVGDVIAYSLDDCDRTAVSNREALARHPRDVRFARRRTIQNRVADKNSLVRNELSASRMTENQSPAGKAFAHVVVGFSLELERKPARSERAETLAR